MPKLTYNNEVMLNISNKKPNSGVSVLERFNGESQTNFSFENRNITNRHAFITERRPNAVRKLATIYVEPQLYRGVSTPEETLRQGTAFSELYRPFLGGGGHV